MNQDITLELQERLQILEELRIKTGKKLQHVPEGSLVVSYCKGKPQYYYYKSSSTSADKDPMKGRKGVYITQKNKALITKLAQKDYYQRLNKAILAEEKAIMAYLRNYPDIPADEVYNVLPEARRTFVMPAIETNEMFAEEWSKLEYVEKGFIGDAPELITDRGEQVRSKSEMLIANLLAKRGVPYRYECPLYLSKAGTIHPDFTVLNVRLRKELYWEHLGMMDSPEYAEKAVVRINAYSQEDIFLNDKLIVTMETATTPINMRQVNSIIDTMLK